MISEDLRIKLEEELRNKWEQLVKDVVNNEFDEDVRLVANADLSQGVRLSIKAKRHRISRDPIKIEGEIQKTDFTNGIDAVLWVIEKIGVDKVYEMDIKIQKNESIVQRWNELPSHDNYKRLGDYAVYCKIPHSSMIAFINEVFEKSNKNALATDMH